MVYVEKNYKCFLNLQNFTLCAMCGAVYAPPGQIINHSNFIF